MWSRRDFCRLVAAGAPAAAMMDAAAQALPAAPVRPAAPRAPLGRLVLAVDHKTSFCHLPLTIAERLGYFADEGLDVQVRETATAGQALQALLGGSAAVGAVAYAHVLSMRWQGHALQSLVLQGRTPQLVLGVSSQHLGHVRHLRELKGRRIAVTGLGQASHRISRLLLERAGLDAQAVQFEVFDGPSATAAALQSGRVDALCYHDPLITRLEQSGDLRVVVDTRTLRGTTDVFGGPLPAGCLAATDEFVRDHPRACQALVGGMVRALKWLQTAGPSDLNKTVPEPYFQGDRGLYMAAFVRTRESWVPDGLMPERGPEIAARLLARLSDVQPSPRIDLSRTFTNQFAQAAKARFRA